MKNSTTAKQILLNAAEVYKTYGKCERFLAVDSNFVPVKWTSPNAVSFCMLGATAKAISSMGVPKTKHYKIFDEMHFLLADAGFNVIQNDDGYGRVDVKLAYDYLNTLAYAVEDKTFTF